MLDKTTNATRYNFDNFKLWPIGTPPSTKCGNTLCECMDRHNYTRRHFCGKSWPIMKLIWIAKSYDQPQNHQQNQYNANQPKPKSLGVFHHHGWTTRWTSPLCPPLPHRLYPPLSTPHSWWRTTYWNATWNPWVNLFMRLLTQVLSKNPLHYVDINFTGLIFDSTLITTIHITSFPPYRHLGPQGSALRGGYCYIPYFPMFSYEYFRLYYDY